MQEIYLERTLGSLWVPEKNFVLEKTLFLIERFTKVCFTLADHCHIELAV